MTGCLGSPSYRNSSAATLSGRSAPGSRPIPFPLLYQGIPMKATISIIQGGNRHERYRVQHVALRAKHHEKLTKMTRTGTYRFICARSIRRSNRNLDVAPRERSDAAYTSRNCRHLIPHGQRLLCALETPLLSATTSVKGRFCHKKSMVRPTRQYATISSCSKKTVIDATHILKLTTSRGTHRGRSELVNVR